MDLGRAAKYGSASALGVVLISLGTYDLMGTVWNDRLSGAEGMAVANIVTIGILGMALAIVFLFVVIGPSSTGNWKREDSASPKNSTARGEGTGRR